MSIAVTMKSIVGKLRNWVGDTGGNITMIIGLAALPLTYAAGLAIDTVRITREQVAFAGAVDSAALAVAASNRSDLTGLTATEKTARIAELKTFASKYLVKNYTPQYNDDTEIALTLDITDSLVTLSAHHDYPTTIMAISGVTELTLNAVSEVTKSGNHIEVALMLDTTGSMAGSKIVSLRAAAKSFVNTVVSPTQNPFYSKVALVPWSMGVNVGSTYAVAARGSVTAGTSTTPGFTSYRFRNANNQNTTFPITNCVSERTGAQAYTDAAVATYKVGRNYAATTSLCASTAIIPLTSNKTALNTAIDTIVASGSTAGQIGIAWGWYMLSPNFGLWTGSSVPAAYNTQHLKKVAILMTDGEFNTPYCNGVISQDATGGSASDHINCNATNGNPCTQSQTLCNAMKAQGIIIYTVAFELSTATAVQNLMTNCATSPSYRYDAANDAQLQAAFQSIAQDLKTLRLSR